MDIAEEDFTRETYTNTSERARKIFLDRKTSWALYNPKEQNELKPLDCTVTVRAVTEPQKSIFKYTLMIPALAPSRVRWRCLTLLRIDHSWEIRSRNQRV